MGKKRKSTQRENAPEMTTSEGVDVSGLIHQMVKDAFVESEIMAKDDSAKDSVLEQTVSEESEAQDVMFDESVSQEVSAKEAMAQEVLEDEVAQSESVDSELLSQQAVTLDAEAGDFVSDNSTDEVTTEAIGDLAEGEARGAELSLDSVSDVVIENVIVESVEDVALELLDSETTDMSLETSEGNSEHQQEPLLDGEHQESLDLGDASVDEAAEPQELEFIDSMQLFSIVESLLFASDKPLSLAALKQVFHGTTVTTKTIKQTMDQLMSMYADPSRGVALEEVNGGWQLRTKLDNMEFLKRIVKTRPFRLSGPALEVLSIIAYKQPIIKNEVDQIRGVESGHLVRALMDKGLVSFEGKTDLPGKPMAYSTTRKFLEIFSLRNLNELPSLGEIDQLLPEGIGEEVEEKETLSDVTERMSTMVTTASYSEGEEELMDITTKLGSISTSSEFFEQEKVRQRQKRDKEKAEDIREALAMGEVVAEKEIRWLEKYEAQLLQEQQAAALAQIQAAEAAQAAIDEASSNAGAEESTDVSTIAVATSDEDAERLADALIAEDEHVDESTEDSISVEDAEV